jgi:hypothetical protein
MADHIYTGGKDSVDLAELARLLGAAGDKTAWTDADLTPAGRRQQLARRGVSVYDTNPEDDIAPLEPSGPPEPTADERIAAAKQTLRDIDTSDLANDLREAEARMNVERTNLTSPGEYGPTGKIYHPGLDTSPAMARLRGALEGMVEGYPLAGKIAATATAGMGALTAAEAAAPFVVPAAKWVAKKATSTPGAAVLGGMEGYRRGGVTGAVEGSLAGVAGSRLLSALEGFAGGGAAAARGAAGAARAASKAAPVAEEAAAAAKTVPKMFRSAESGAYEAERLYADAIKKGYNEQVARKMAGMPDRSMIYNEAKGSAFPSNVEFGGESPTGGVMVEPAGTGTTQDLSMLVDNPHAIDPSALAHDLNQSSAALNHPAGGKGVDPSTLKGVNPALSEVQRLLDELIRTTSSVHKIPRR